jgi:dolichol-phosphate mannosyltransferase
MFDVLSSVSLAAPAYNEAAGIEEVVSAWVRYLSTRCAPGDFEIVICDDGSRDETGAILDRLATSIPELRPVHHARNQGAAAALTTAIRHTTKDWVLLIDSDGQFPVENLERLTPAAADGAEAVIGVRTRKQDGAIARFGSATSGALCNWFCGTRYRDFNCALKLVRGPLVRSLNLEAKGLNYSGEITAKLIELSVSLAEVEIAHQARKCGKSSANARAVLHRMLFVAYLGFRQFLLRNEVLRRPAP